MRDKLLNKVRTAFKVGVKATLRDAKLTAKELYRFKNSRSVATPAQARELLCIFEKPSQYA